MVRHGATGRPGSSDHLLDSSSHQRPQLVRDPDPLAGHGLRSKPLSLRPDVLGSRLEPCGQDPTTTEGPSAETRECPVREVHGDAR